MQRRAGTDPGPNGWRGEYASQSQADTVRLERIKEERHDAVRVDRWILRRILGLCKRV